jgi:hypothetical protein
LSSAITYFGKIKIINDAPVVSSITANKKISVTGDDTVIALSAMPGFPIIIDGDLICGDSTEKLEGYYAMAATESDFENNSGIVDKIKALGNTLG